MARLSGKPVDPGSVEISDTYRRQAQKRVVVRIHPEKWASWDHSKLAGAWPPGRLKPPKNE